MSTDGWTIAWTLLNLPLGAVAVGALVVAWRNRRAKPAAAKLFGSGVALLAGANAADLMLYTLFPMHEWLPPGLIDVQVAYFLTGAVRQGVSVIAAVLVTAAVFLPKSPADGRPAGGGG